jgi:serine protease Do
MLLLASCRPRPGAGEGSGSAAPAPTPPGVAPASTRVLYPSGGGDSPRSFHDLVAGAKHGVVGIKAATPVKSGPAAMFPGAPETTADVALGTGWLVEAQGVFVVTTDKIAAASTALKVVLPDRSEVDARVRGRDVPLDVALLEIDVPRLRPLPLGDSNQIKVGEWVVVLGNALGEDITASAGVVSSTGREGAGSLPAGRQAGFRTFIQTDARIHRGNSGGPVIDTAGQVIGMAVATDDHVGEISFAVPVERLREVLPQLRDQGKVTRAFFGAKVLPVSPENAERYGLVRAGGALVTELEPSSPALAAGVRPGDIILSWNGRAVTHVDLPWIVAQTPPGSKVAVVLWRNKAELSVSATVQAWKQ